MRSRISPLALVVVAFAAGLAAGQARGQAKPRMWADVVLDIVTDELPRKARVHVNVDHWDPGAETGRHTHPGPVVFVVLDGELSETRADGSTGVLRTGQAFWKTSRTDHNVRNASAQPARALAVHLHPAR